MNKDEQVLLIRKTFAEISEIYSQTASIYANILALGDYGSGKTQLYSSCPFPVLIHSFDSGGTTTAALQPLIKRGLIIVEKFESDDWKRPSEYLRWEKRMLELKRMNFFASIGTYGMDSLTNWVVCLMHHIMRAGLGKGVATHAGQAPYQSDYLWQQLHAGNILRKEIMTLPCHTLMTGHLHAKQDELTGSIEMGLLMWGKIADQIPLVFDEKYIMRVNAAGIHQLQTKSDGRFKAETRMGGDKFEKFEKPDIRALLKRAGKSWQDKELVAGGEDETSIR